MAPGGESVEAAEPPRRIGSYTTARVTGGRVERAERHARRLRRDAGRLELPLPGQVEIEALLLETARETFGEGDGIVRIEWSALPGAAPELSALTRPIGPDPDRWHAGFGDAIHPGPELRRNTKFVDVSAYALARDQVAKSAFDEVLLFDSEGYLVEGGHSNFVVVTEAGELVAPDPALGAVEGLGLTILLESRPEIVFGRLTREDVTRARELMSINAVRGAVAIVRLEGREMSGGGPGPWTRRLRGTFARDWDRTD